MIRILSMTLYRTAMDENHHHHQHDIRNFMLNFCVSSSCRQLKKQLQFQENKFSEFQVSKLVLKEV